MADLARACELASNNVNIPYGCIAVAAQLNKEGQREALILMLSRTLAVNDDPEASARESGHATGLAVMQADIFCNTRQKSAFL